MAPRAERKLAAILAADVVGYSRLVGADETGTIARLKALRKEFIEPLIAEYHGRVVKLMGDGALVEFASAVDAVECAVAIQQGVAEREASEPEERCIQFRVGINLGDVIIEGDDIYGDGVNIAARMEGLAEPGGICVARNVHNQVKAKLALAFEPMGQHRVKNIAEPVEVWRVLLDGSVPKPKLKARRLAPVAIAAGVAGLLALGAGGAWLWQQSRAAVQTTATDPVLAMPSGPSIAVLPFTNLTGDPAQEYFVDGVTEDIITELSKFQAFRVIARNSTFRYKGQAVDVRQVGKELGARYVVEGSVRRSPERIRVSVQLLDATDGEHVWGETYDRALTAEDVFAIQDELTRAVATTIADEHGVLSRTISERARRKRTEELSSYECVLRLHEYNRVLTPETHLAALTCLRRTVEVDPNYGDAWAALAEIYVDSYGNGFNPVDNALDKALDAAERALAIDPRNQQGQYGLAYAYFARRELESFMVNIEKVVRLNPNNGYYLGAAGWTIALSGQCDRGRELFDKAVKLNPYHPGWMLYPFIVCHYWADEYELALAEAHNLGLPDFFWTPMMFAAIYGQMGRTKEAQEALADALKLNPDLAERPHFYIGAFVVPEEFINKLVDGLRKAGLEAPATG
jgi:TolB-like protein/class 3 adenylate cyclase/cytochrome c-type biogenesis protein CcmH/NrfG